MDRLIIKWYNSSLRHGNESEGGGKGQSNSGYLSTAQGSTASPLTIPVLKAVDSCSAYLSARSYILLTTAGHLLLVVTSNEKQHLPHRARVEEAREHDSIERRHVPYRARGEGARRVLSFSWWLRVSTSQDVDTAHVG